MGEYWERWGSWFENFSHVGGVFKTTGADSVAQRAKPPTVVSAFPSEISSISWLQISSIHCSHMGAN